MKTCPYASTYLPKIEPVSNVQLLKWLDSHQSGCLPSLNYQAILAVQIKRAAKRDHRRGLDLDIVKWVQKKGHWHTGLYQAAASSNQLDFLKWARRFSCSELTGRGRKSNCSGPCSNCGWLTRICNQSVKVGQARLPTIKFMVGQGLGSGQKFYSLLAKSAAKRGRYKLLEWSVEKTNYNDWVTVALEKGVTSGKVVLLDRAARSLSHSSERNVVKLALKHSSLSALQWVVKQYKEGREYGYFGFLNDSLFFQLAESESTANLAIFEWLLEKVGLENIEECLKIARFCASEKTIQLLTRHYPDRVVSNKRRKFLSSA